MPEFIAGWKASMGLAAAMEGTNWLVAAAARSGLKALGLGWPHWLSIGAVTKAGALWVKVIAGRLNHPKT